MRRRSLLITTQTYRFAVLGLASATAFLLLARAASAEKKSAPVQAPFPMPHLQRPVFPPRTVEIRAPLGVLKALARSDPSNE